MKDSLLHENWESGKEETDPVLRVFQNCLFPFPAGRPPSLTGFLWWYITQYNYLSSDYVSILKDRRQGRSLVVTFMILLQSTDITNWATKQSNVRFSIKILTIYCKLDSSRWLALLSSLHHTVQLQPLYNWTLHPVSSPPVIGLNDELCLLIAFLTLIITRRRSPHSSPNQMEGSDDNEILFTVMVSDGNLHHLHFTTSPRHQQVWVCVDWEAPGPISAWNL